jgi:hypothetical protein
VLDLYRDLTFLEECDNVYRKSLNTDCCELIAMIHFATQSLFKRTQFFLIIVITLWFVAFPVYLYLSALDDLSEISPCLSFKAVDEDNSVAMVDHKEKILIPTFEAKKHSEVIFFFESTRNFYPNGFDSCSKQLILRC